MRRDKQSTNFVKKSQRVNKKNKNWLRKMRDKLIYNSPESRIAISNTHTHTQMRTYIEAIECSVNILRFLVYY